MPFVITTKRPCTCVADSCHGDPEIDACVCGGRVSRRAVATLERARREMRDAMHKAWNWRERDQYAWDEVAQHEAVESWPGTFSLLLSVGPLPDGTVIEVEPIWWADLRERAGLDRDGFTLDAQTIAAYNAAQEAS